MLVKKADKKGELMYRVPNTSPLHLHLHLHSKLLNKKTMINRQWILLQTQMVTQLSPQKCPWKIRWKGKSSWWYVHKEKTTNTKHPCVLFVIDSSSELRLYISCPRNEYWKIYTGSALKHIKNSTTEKNYTQFLFNNITWLNHLVFDFPQERI